MTRLYPRTREILRERGFTTRQWAQLHGYASAADWGGDKCGCTDDRCIGHHHEENEECDCLYALIDEQFLKEHSEGCARGIWAAHLHAEETGAAEDRAHVAERLAWWIGEFHPGAVAYALTPRGFIYRGQYNDSTWLVYNAATGRAEVEEVDGADAEPIATARKAGA